MKHITNLFKGRINRLNYLIGFIITAVLMYLLTLGLFYREFLIIPIYALVVIFGLSLQARRWHDFNRPWYYAIYAILFTMSIGILSKDIGNISKLIYLVALVAVGGSKGKNRYGDEDKTVGLKSVLGLLS